MKAILLGASGASGSVLLDELLNDERFTNIKAYTRKTLDIKHAKLDNVVINFDDISSLDLSGADVIFSTLGTTLKDAKSKQAQYKVDVVYQLEFARAAIRAGVSRAVLLSSAGANPNSSVFYTRIKGELDEAMMGLGFRGLFIFRPSILLRVGRLRFGERINLVVLRFLNKLGLFRRLAAQDLTKLAKAMIKAGTSDDIGVHIYTLNEIDAFLS